MGETESVKAGQRKQVMQSQREFNHSIVEKLIFTGIFFYFLSNMQVNMLRIYTVCSISTRIPVVWFSLCNFLRN